MEMNMVDENKETQDGKHRHQYGRIRNLDQWLVTLQLLIDLWNGRQAIVTLNKFIEISLRNVDVPCSLSSEFGMKSSKILLDKNRGSITQKFSCSHSMTLIDSPVKISRLNESVRILEGFGSYQFLETAAI